MILFQEYETCANSTVSKLWDLINNSKSTDWWRENETVELKINIPHGTFNDDKKTTLLINKFVENNRMYIQKLEPNTSYNWHKDYARNASISLCLNQHKDSLTLFSKKRHVNHFYELTPLFYKPNTMYLFNGSEWHCGLNYSNETRYLISISLTRPSTIETALMYLNTVN